MELLSQLRNPGLFRVSCILLVVISLTACSKGKDGPTGPQGPQGAPGPQGPQGPIGAANVTYSA